MTARVTALAAPIPEIRVLRLVPDLPFAYRPGQYLALGFSDGPKRSFSMATAPAADGAIELHIRRRKGGYVSEFILDRIVPGDTLAIDGPYGELSWPAGDGPVILLATGTGIAPLKAMLEAALVPDGDRPVALYWGGRREGDLYAAPLFGAWQARHPAFRFVPVLSAAGPDWPGRRGSVPCAAAADAVLGAHATVIACGSPAMVAEAHRLFVEERGLAPHAFLADPFEPADALMGGIAGPPIRISLEGRAAAYSVAVPTGMPLHAALRAAGLPLLAICGGKASCGTCRVGIAAAWADRLAPPGRGERHLLACLPEARPGDRLACQIPLTPSLDGLVVRLFLDPE